MAKAFTPVVLPLTLHGKVLCFIIALLCRILWIFKGHAWKRPWPGFEENPRHFTRMGLLYFAYKYYFRSPELPDGNEPMRYGKPEPAPEGAEKKAEYRLSVGGDLMPYAWITRASAAELWDHCGNWFFDADLVFANLETPLRPDKPLSAVPEVMLSDMLFNANEELFQLFNGAGKYKGFDVLSTANNHSLDAGEEGVKATLDFLERKGIASTGTARTPAEQWDFPILERNGIKTAFIAATYCLNHFAPPEEDWRINTGRFNLPGADISLLIKLVHHARERGADLVVLSLHTGNAYQAYPSAHTRMIFDRIFKEAMPDMILGGHPHNPQPPEWITYRDADGEERKGLAVYSLGDFVAYDIYTWCHLHLGLKLTLVQWEREGKKITRLSDVEVMPMMMKADKMQGRWRFAFHPLLELKAEKESPRLRKEVLELQRFWKEHLEVGWGAFVRKRNSLHGE